jgi:uncharacterized protein YecT (DUF1311 family)
VIANKNLILVFTLCCITKIVSAQDIGLTKQFSVCMDKSNGVTINMMDCIGEETKRQDKRLNQAYKDLMDQLTAERKKQLQNAQRAWLTFRDENCTFYADPDGGSMARVSANDCFMSATAMRSKELETLSGKPDSTASKPSPKVENKASASSPGNTKNATQSLTAQQKNAVKAAKSYLSFTAFSRDGLIHQLSSSAGSGFDVKDATIAVDSLDIDWNNEAVKSAKDYLKLMGFSCNGLVQQLSSRAGGKFTESQARFGAKQAGAC